MPNKLSYAKCLKYARNAYNSSNFRLASDLFAIARELKPENAEAYIGGYETALGQSNLQEADDICLAALRNAFQPRFLLYRARLATLREDPFEAMDRWKEAWSLFPDQGVLEMGDLLLKLKKYDQAARLYDNAYRQFREPQYLCNTAKTAYLAGDYKKASELWKKTARLMPLDEQSYSDWLRSEIKLKKYASAEKICEEALRGFPHGKFLEQHAQLAELQGRDEEALGRWEKARKEIGDKHYLYSIPVEILIRLGRLDEAQKLCDEGMEKSPAGIHWVNYGKIALKRGQYNLASSYFEKARSLAPKNHHGYIGAIETAIQLGEYRKAEKICSIAIRKFPFHVFLHKYAEIATLLGNHVAALERWAKFRAVTKIHGYLPSAGVLMRLGRHAEALDMCFEGMQKSFDPAFLSIFEQAAAACAYSIPDEFLIQLGRLNKAQSPSEESMENLPAGIYWINLAKKAFERGQFELAFSSYEKGRSLEPKNRNAYIGAIEAAIQLGEYMKAEEICAAAIREFPFQIFLAKYAEIATLRENYLTALERWATLRSVSGEEGYLPAARLLMQLGRYAEAREMCRAGLKMAYDPAFMQIEAQAAEALKK